MPAQLREDSLATIAGDIMFSKEFVDVLQEAYSDERSLQDFEVDPRGFLARHGIDMPDGIEVVLHDRGTVGRPGRVDLHWQATAPDDGSGQMRRTARRAWDLLTSDEMDRLRERIRGSSKELDRFVADPKGYAATHGVHVADNMELLVHADDPADPRVDVHFSVKGIVGCYYCSGGSCCCYQVQ